MKLRIINKKETIDISIGDDVNIISEIQAHITDCLYGTTKFIQIPSIDNNVVCMSRKEVKRSIFLYFK
jgi:hypothetical protein